MESYLLERIEVYLRVGFQLEAVCMLRKWTLDACTKQRQKKRDQDNPALLFNNAALDKIRNEH